MVTECELKSKADKHNYNWSLLTLTMVWLGWFYGISTIVGYLMPNPNVISQV